MIRIRGSLVLALLIVLVPTGALANGEIKAFEYKDGERWMFRVTEEFGALSNSEALSGDYEAVFPQKGLIFFQSTAKKKSRSANRSVKFFCKCSVKDRLMAESISSFP